MGNENVNGISILKRFFEIEYGQKFDQSELYLKLQECLEKINEDGTSVLNDFSFFHGFVNDGIRSQKVNDRFYFGLIFLQILITLILFYTGVIFCLIIVVPNALAFFSTVGPSNLEISTDISRFYSFVLTLSFAFGIAFQVPLIVNILISLNILNKNKIKEYRGIVLVSCFIFGMIFTPPDVISQILLAVPMYLLFELGLLFSNEKKKKSNS